MGSCPGCNEQSTRRHSRVFRTSSGPRGARRRRDAVSLNDYADRTPRELKDGEIIELGGGKRVRYAPGP